MLSVKEINALKSKIEDLEQERDEYKECFTSTDINAKKIQTKLFEKEELCKELKQENTKQKKMINRQWKLLEQCGVSAGGELKRVSYLLENLRKENKELKEFCIELEKQKEIQHNQWFERCTENQNEDSKIIDKYKSALEEIREMCKRQDFNQGMRTFEMLKFINEVLE